MEKNVYTVSEVNRYIKNLFSTDFFLKHVYVKGEVSNCKYHTSGHIYFTLKDAGGVISCVMFRGNRSGLGFQMQEGQKVIVLGEITTYEAAGKYQLYAKEIVMDGIGNLYQRYEQLKKELEEMGMFSQEYKKPIPRYAMKVGVVTASTGAAIQDIINISRRRNPYVQLYLYPAIVQGQSAAKSIVMGIECLDRMHLDVLIVGRGGGSLEDLFAFNEEIVARAIFDCETPVISAVGHEVDYTIADFVADLRAPTPSAAAELAVFDYNLFEQDLDKLKNRMKISLQYQLNDTRTVLGQYQKRLSYFHPRMQTARQRQQLDDLITRMQLAKDRTLKENQLRLKGLAGRIDAMSPLKKISKGFAYLENENGDPVISINNVKEKDRLQIMISDGQIDAEVISTTEVKGDYK